MRDDDSNASIDVMGTITVRNLDEAVKQALRQRAATGGHSLEEEVRRTLKESVDRHPRADGDALLAASWAALNSIFRRVAQLGGRRLSNDNPRYECRIGNDEARAASRPRALDRKSTSG